jgi:hypothetical protein
MPKHIPLSKFVVISTDPDAEWRSLYVEVRAHSKEHARDVARAELAKTKRDHFTIDMVLVA